MNRRRRIPGHRNQPGGRRPARGPVAGRAASVLDDERSGRAALVVTELATNLVKHARGGEILLRPLTSSIGEPEGIEILAVDKGPGIPDVAPSRSDGFSTTGTLGHGLGAIERQADAFDLYTQPTRHGPSSPRSAASRRRAVSASRSAVSRSAPSTSAKSGEDVCGDDWAWRMRDRAAGHPRRRRPRARAAAHEAARAATACFRQGARARTRRT